MDMKEKLKKAVKGDKSRGQGLFGIFIAIGIGLVIVAVILGIGAYVMEEIYDTMDSPASVNETFIEHNITNDTLIAMNTAASWVNIYTIIAIAVAIVGLIFLMAGGVTRSEVRGMARGRGGRRRL